MTRLLDVFLSTWEHIAPDPANPPRSPFISAMRRVDYRAAFAVNSPSIVVGIQLRDHDTGELIAMLDLRPPSEDGDGV